MAMDSRQHREVFHFLFLERLLKISDPRLYVLKGGVNLRFYFNSPRYSEDMDLDVLGGSVTTLNKNGYRILKDPAFIRSLSTFGITEVIVNDPGKAKQTQTTQRFRARIITRAGESLPIKVEFSRRGPDDGFLTENINPEVARPYRRLAFPCQHYAASTAVRQKVSALANRAQIQVRDVFDLYILWLGGHVDYLPMVSEADRALALNNLLSFSFEDYQGHVLDYLETEQYERFATKDVWDDMCETVFKILESSE